MATKTTGEASVEELTAQIELLKKDISTLMRTAGDVGRSQAASAADTARARAGEIREGAEHYAELAGQRASEGAEAALETIRRQPASSVAIAVGIGFLIGLVTSSNRR